jgi:hypothetical protein
MQNEHKQTKSLVFGLFSVYITELALELAVRHSADNLHSLFRLFVQLFSDRLF